MKKPPSAAWRSMRLRVRRRLLRSYQRRLTLQARHWLSDATMGASQKARLPPIWSAREPSQEAIAPRWNRLGRDEDPDRHRGLEERGPGPVASPDSYQG